ncbi:MAG: hypothetical protein PHV60_04690 [bacterium]|nr:hypothetical protein [bacterium]
MRKRSILLVVLLLVLLLTSLCLAEDKSVESVTVSKVVAVPAATAGSVQVSGNGNITLESDDVEATCSQIQSLTKKYDAAVRNFNINDVPNTKYKNASMDLSLDIASATVFMNEVLTLGKVRGNSYNENRQMDNIDDLNKQLAELKDSFDKMIRNKPDVEVLKVLVTKITDIENRIRNLQYNDRELGKARIYINVQQKGWNRNQQTANNTPKNWTLIITAVIFLFIGIFARNLITKKPQV